MNIKKYFNNYDILDLKYSDLLKNNDNQIKEENPLFKEYIIFSYLYNNAGLFLYGDFEFIKSIKAFFENDFFIGF